MAIKTPEWAKKAGAYPTVNGWTVDRTKGRTEVIKATKLSASDIAEWYGVQDTPIQTLHEAPHQEVVIDKEIYEFHTASLVDDLDETLEADKEV